MDKNISNYLFLAIKKVTNFGNFYIPFFGYFYIIIYNQAEHNLFEIEKDGNNSCFSSFDSTGSFAVFT